MSFLITMAAFLGILVVLILVHELGHFTAAKLSGVRVYEFGLGFPPRLFGFKHGETIYSVNAVPLGGFTKMAGEEDPKEPRGLSSKNRGIRLIVLAAGSIMNALLPIVLFSVAFMVPHDTLVGKVMIEEVVAGSPAATAGIQAGDQVISINNEAVQNLGDINRLVRLNLGNEIDILVKHADDSQEEVSLVPRWRPPAGQGAVGVGMQFTDYTIVRSSEPFWRAIPLGVKQCVETFVLFKNEIIGLFIGTSTMQVAGPIGIAQISGEVAKAGVSPLLEFAAFLSINLAIINILPLPALDGGRIVFVLIEIVRRGRRVSPQTERLVHLIGFMLLMGLTLVITYGDIIRIMSGGDILP